MGYRIMVSPDRIRVPIPPFMLDTQGSIANFDYTHCEIGNIRQPSNTVVNLGKLKNAIPVDEEEEEEESRHLNRNPSSSSSLSPPIQIPIKNLILNETLKKSAGAGAGDEVWNLNPPESKPFLPHTTAFEELFVQVANNDAGTTPYMGIDPVSEGWLQFQMANVHHHQAVVESNFQVTGSGYEGSGMDSGGGYPEKQEEGGGEKKRKVIVDEMMEKTIERRQKRMIKNRESAARSRARKQAHTTQLETKVVELRRSNNWLKKQKEMDMLLDSYGPHTPRYQLRRTSSCLF